VPPARRLATEAEVMWGGESGIRTAVAALDLTDRAMTALRDGLAPGLSERELGALVERAYVAQGGPI
jgi:Xaa-Pro aminopeptidase